MRKIKQKFKIALIGRGPLLYKLLFKTLQDSNIKITCVVICNSTSELDNKQKEILKLAKEKQIQSFLTSKINNPRFVKIFKKLENDLIISISWIYMLKKEIIASSRIGILNIHGGLLPKYRGNACGNWAILNNEKEIGLTVHLMEPSKLDSGPIISQVKINIENKYIGEITEDCFKKGIKLLLNAIKELRMHNSTYRYQNQANALYCYPRLPRDGEINWTKSAAEIHKLVRASADPYPGAYSFFEDYKEKQIKKLTIFKAVVIELENDFLAVPGHVIKTDNFKTRSVVCGDKKLLRLDEIKIDNEFVEPNAAFDTVRQRLGLDTETILNNLRLY